MREFTEKYIEIEGFAGSFGAALIFKQNEAEFRKFFRTDLCDEAAGLGDKCELRFCEQGIIAEINRACKEEKCGYELELRKIPVKQLTIEVCERAQLSPYDLPCYANVKLVDKKTPASCGHTTQALRKTLIR